MATFKNDISNGLLDENIQFMILTLNKFNKTYKIYQKVIINNKMKKSSCECKSVETGILAKISFIVDRKYN